MKASKRLLALVLCLAIVLSLGTVAFAAESAGIDNAELAAAPEQVKWLVDNGYVAGYDDGTLKLDSNITRAQFATILARATGLADADAPTYAAMAPNYFSDVAADAWYAGYVAYCYGKEIVAGYGDGTFKPEADVTGIEAAKMILCAVEGYDQAAYVNTPLWSFNVMTDAEADGLLVGVDADLAAASTREVAFIMLYNALYEAELDGHGLAYVKDYDVAALELYGGDGSDDSPFEYVIAHGDYTAASFKAFNADAVIELFEYTVDTTTTKGVLTPVSIVTLGDEEGEQYFFVKVTDPDGEVTWYRFIAQDAFEFSEFKGIVIANEFASLDDLRPLKAGQTQVLVRGAVITVAATTYLNDIGMTFKGETLEYQQGTRVLNLASFEATGEDKTVLVHDDKEVRDATDGPRAAFQLGRGTEYYVNFAVGTDDEYEVIRVIKDADGKVLAKIGEKVTGTEAAKMYDDAAASAEYTYGAWLRYFFDNQSTIKVYDEKILNGFENGYVAKLIDNDGDDVADYVLKFVYTGYESYKPAPKEDVGGKVEFADLAFGGDKGEGVSLVAFIDGVTYITDAASEVPVIAKKLSEVDFASGISTNTVIRQPGNVIVKTMADAGYKICDNVPFPDALEVGETYVVYYDLYGNSFAAIEAGLGDYVLVTQIDRASGNLRGYVFSTYLVFGDVEEDTYTVSDTTLQDLETWGYDGNWINHIWNKLPNAYDAGNQTYWTALASYYNKDSEAKTIGLADPYVTNKVNYVSIAYPGDVVAKTQKLEGVALTNKYGNPVGGSTLYINKDTEVYIVTGTNLVSGLLTKAEYGVGYNAIPAILRENIHGIYGVVSLEADYAVAEVLVIEVTANDGGKGAFAFRGRTIENIGFFNDRDYIGFAAIDEENEVIARKIGSNEGLTNPYIRFWAPFTSVLAEYPDVEAPLYLKDANKNLSSFELEAVAVNPLNGKTYTVTGWADKDAPIYVITDRGPEKASYLPDARPGEAFYEEGDIMVVVYEDTLLSVSGYNENFTTAAYGDKVAYLIDVSKSIVPVQEYFNVQAVPYNGVYVAGGVTVGSVTTMVPYNYSAAEDLVKAALETPANIPTGYQLIPGGYSFDGTTGTYQVEPAKFNLNTKADYTKFFTFTYNTDFNAVVADKVTYGQTAVIKFDFTGTQYTESADDFAYVNAEKTDIIVVKGINVYVDGKILLEIVDPVELAKIMTDKSFAIMGTGITGAVQIELVATYDKLATETPAT